MKFKTLLIFITSISLFFTFCSIEKVDELDNGYSSPFGTNDMFPNTVALDNAEFGEQTVYGLITNENQKDAYKFYGHNGQVKYITLSFDESEADMHVEFYDPYQELIGIGFNNQQLTHLIYYEGWFFVRVVPDSVYSLPVNYTLTVKTP